MRKYSFKLQLHSLGNKHLDAQELSFILMTDLQLKDEKDLRIMDSWLDERILVIMYNDTSTLSFTQTDGQRIENKSNGLCKEIELRNKKKKLCQILFFFSPTVTL